MTEVRLGKKLAEGKTKIIYAGPEGQSDDGDRGAYAYMVHKDAITAGDGQQRDVIDGKGVLSCRTTAAVFRYLEACGITTHFVDTVDERTMLVRRVDMVPIEWVARRIAAGSYVRRTGTAEGSLLTPLVLELFLKDDERHDPQIDPAEATASGLCTGQEVAEALATTEQVFLALEAAWTKQDIQLVDLKIEFGRCGSEMIVADVIDNDSWRLWPRGQRDLMLDKQVYRELQERDASALQAVRLRYEEVADRAERFHPGRT
jgi:phosphoribosylaminoimidazole-succinocarboxamide synthase